MSTNDLYPIFTKPDQIHTLLVGGGNVALEKLNSILSNSPNAKIKIVSPEIKKEILELASEKPDLQVINRKFMDSDIEHQTLIICATNDHELHKHIYNLAAGENKLINVADTPSLCTFYLSSIVQKGNLKIAISTNGKSPTLAKRLKEILNDALPEEIDQVLHNLEMIRNKLKGDFTEKVKRMNEITESMKSSKD